MIQIIEVLIYSEGLWWVLILILCIELARRYYKRIAPTLKKIRNKLRKQSMDREEFKDQYSEISNSEAIKASREVHLPYKFANEHLSSHIKGGQLSAVCFVMDYLQLQFDGQYDILTITCKTSVQDHLGEIEWKEVGFRDRICGIITNIVAETEITSDSLTITFENQAKIIASLWEDMKGIESIAFYPHGEREDFWVI